uniref:hypothetical protein n=2 Tax=Enterococcus faecalis TaxID=1351 RepID=UPI00359C17D8
MQIIMNEVCVKENLGDVMLLGVNVRHPYNSETRTYDETVIDSVTVNLACSKLENSISVNLEEKEVPNVKNWGKVRVAGLVYAPTASANSYEDQSGKMRSYGSINDRFTAVRIEPMTPADRKADENGQILSDKASDSKKTEKLEK